MRTMYSPLFQTAGFQLAVIVFFATAPFIIATTPSSQPGLQLGDPVVQRRDKGLPTGWAELGCYSTSPDRPTLTAETYTDTNNMTVENCVELCISHEKALAGVENGVDCHCGNVMTIGAADDSASDCSYKCAGDPDQFCGGSHSDYMNIYSDGTPLQPLPIIPQNPLDWFLVGCFLDSDAARTLYTKLFIGTVNSPDTCILACKEASFWIAGMEFAYECWCSNSIQQGRRPVDPAFCPLACPGNSFQICGGAHSMVIYSEHIINFGP